MGAILLASLLSGPASAAKPALVLALDDPKAQHCRPVPDGSQICDDPTGGSGIGLGGADPNPQYMACKTRCDEQAKTLLESKRSGYIKKCLRGCQKRFG
jgi:hypothetical protein